MPDAPVIETAELCKTYGRVRALRGLTLAAHRGRITGFLGRNGAGKTTAIKTFMGMVRPTGGDVRVFGLDAADPRASVEIRRRTGLVGEEKELDGQMRVGQVLAFTRAFYPAWRADLETRYLDRFALPADRRIKALSHGARTKLVLLLALCRGAELLVLDEPTSALDPEAAEVVLQAIVGQVAEDGLSVFFSSHQLSDVEQIADDVVIVDHGRAAAAGPLDELQQSFRRLRLVFEGDAPPAALTSPGVLRASVSGRVLEIVARLYPDAAPNDDPVLREVRALSPASIDVTAMTLKEIFLETVRTEA